MGHMSPRLKERRGRFSGVGFDPVVTITSPADPHSMVVAALPLAVTATAVDGQDGDVAASLIWVSDIDGQVGVGAAPSLTLTQAIHVITATATDSNSNTGSAILNVTVNA